MVSWGEGVVVEGVNRRAVKGVRGGDSLSLGGGDGSTLGGGKGPTGRGEEGSTLGGGHLKIVFKYNNSLIPVDDRCGSCCGSLL